MTTQTFKISRTYPIRQYQNWISQTEELIDTVPEPTNVLFWGAKGNGITDDTVAIQEAITANLRGELFFPSGIYLITATLIIEDDITICGENYIYTIIRSTVHPAITIGGTTTANPPNLVWCNMTVDADGITSVASSSAVIVYNMAGGYWENIFIQSSAQNGLYFFPGNLQRVAYNLYQNLMITSNIPTITNYPLTIAATGTGYSNENTFQGGRFIGNALTPYLINGTYGNYNRFFNTTLEGPATMFSAFLATLTAYFFYGCRFEGTKGLLNQGAFLNSINGQYKAQDTLQTYFVAASASFAIGDVITGGTSAITAVVVAIPSATTLSLSTKSSVLPFTYGETITGVPSGGSTTINQLQSVPNGVYDNSGNGSIATYVTSNNSNTIPLNYFMQSGSTSAWNTIMNNSFISSGNSNVLQLIAARGTGAFIQADRAGVTRFSVEPTNGTVNTTGVYNVSATQVVGPRAAGWGVSVTGANAATNVNATTITATDPNIQALAAVVNAMKSAMLTHGLIGA